MIPELSFLIQNRFERERLKQVAARITDEELSRVVEGEWTVSAVFAHLAFWDKQRLEQITHWEQNGFDTFVYDADVFNAALLPLWLALPPRKAVELAVEAAEAIDAKLESLSLEFISQIQAQPYAPNLERALHRQEHLEQMARVGIQV